MIPPSPASGAHRDDVSGYPIQYAKVQPPPLREETLARHRLLDWLAQKINQRVVLVLADAGYGKTTLLADFANRTRLRTLWYRLDEDDRDWISLLSHLVAAGREVDPSFAPRTAGLLADTSLSGPTRDAVIDAFIRELPAIAPQGTVLIFDDFHLVDDAPDAQLITRRIVAEAPERLSVIFASRRPPGIPMAKLRAMGEVSALATDDLRFDADETERLFRDTYHRSLDPEVMADVAARTEGWAASLQLVNAALRDRSPGEIRKFIRSLSGGDQELYDYLAEEVVGDLPADLQEFLMRTSILQVVTPKFAEVASARDEMDVSRLTTAAERLTLLGRRARGPKSELRYHPLVREFLEARLTREVGPAGVRDLHRVIADHAEGHDWRVAAHHLWLSNDQSKALDIIDNAVQGIIGRGEYLIAAPYVADLDGDSARSSFQVVLSRRDFKQGDVREALARAERAVAIEPSSGVALANLASLTLTLGDVDASEKAANQLLKSTADPEWVRIAQEILMLIDTSVAEDIEVAISRLQRMAAEQRRAGQSHFEGITYLNLAEAYRATDQATDSLDVARSAIDRLEASSNAAEISSAHALAAWSLIHSEQTRAGWLELDVALAGEHEAIRIDVLVEASYLEALYGSNSRALDYLAEIERSRERFPLLSRTIVAVSAYLAIRGGEFRRADHLISSQSADQPTIFMAYKSFLLCVKAHSLVAQGSPDALLAIKEARAQSQKQSARRWTAYCDAIQAAQAGPLAINRYIRVRQRRGMWAVTYAAELFADRLHVLGETELDALRVEATLRPERWRPALRSSVDIQGDPSLPAARLLESVGEQIDVARLRRVGRRQRGTPDADLGRGLARSVAERVVIEDLGRVQIGVGRHRVEGSAIRRKVLALLCFMLSRPRFAATRDEVMDALWPEFDPADALNSLNQTVYFLRRIFEPNYKDDLSPGYVHHESDLLWLDEELITATSRRCMDVIRLLPVDPTPDQVAELSRLYVGEFALDFAYEDWAATYRSSIHSSYLQVIERAVAADTEAGHFGRGIDLARRALDLAPDADQIELSLLRLYRLAGSHAAAAEQYGHYAAAVRDALGIEAPPLDSL